MFKPIRVKKMSIMMLYILFLLLITAACAANTAKNSSPIPAHKTYNYAHAALPINTIFQPDHQLYTLQSKKSLELLWKPHAAQPSMNQQPVSVTINGALIGPFTSSDALKKAIQNSDFTQKPIVASFAPMQTTSWVDKTYTSNMTLPPAIAPGYYILLQMITLSGQNQHVVGKASMEIEVPST